MKALLIYPEFPDTFWSFKHALKFVSKKAAIPPLGLLTVAAMLPKDWGKRLIDMNVSKLKTADLEWADIVFFSGMIVQKKSASDAIARCKRAGLCVVAGGPLFSEAVMDFPQVDHFILGEAENNLPLFLKDFSEGKAKKIYEPGDFPEINNSPVPSWELLEMNKYVTMSLQYSRGCPFNCDFCNVTSLFGHKCRIKSTKQVIAELDKIYQMGWRSGVFFVDDNFIGNKARLKKDLLPALIEWQKGKRGITFLTEASINIADDQELMELMAKAGFDTVFIGIETPEEKSLAECSKGQNINRNLLKDIKKIQRNGLNVQGGFIVGFDHDSDNIFQRQIEFIQKSGITVAMVGMLQALPGTRLYSRMQKEGRLIGDSTGDNVDGSTNIIPSNMSVEHLKQGYLKILDEIYSPRNYYHRVKTFLKEYKSPIVKTPLRFSQILAFLKSIYLLGILGKERFQYWKLLLWTQFRRPEFVPLAVTLAIYGYHFRKIAQKNQI